MDEIGAFVFMLHDAMKTRGRNRTRPMTETHGSISARVERYLAAIETHNDAVNAVLALTSPTDPAAGSCTAPPC